MRKKKCIVTYARSWIALAAVRCLGKHGIHVITGDTERGAIANFSRYSMEQFVYPDPLTDADGFIDRLAALAGEHSSDDTDLVIMPMYNEVYPLILHQGRFNGLAKIVLPPEVAYELVRNKAKIAVHCGKLGVKIPITIVPESRDEFYDLARGIKYPAFVKIPDGSGSLGICKVSCYDEAVKAFDGMALRYNATKPGKLPILQEFAGGNDYCSTFLFDNGEYRASMTYRNVVQIQRGKGVGIVRETVEAGPLEEIGRRMLEDLNWNGVCQIDFRWDGVSEPWFIEVNPRFWGGLAQSIASGWPFPLWMYELALKGNIVLRKPEKINVRTANRTLVAVRMIRDLFNARDASGPDGRVKGVVKLIKECRGAVNEFSQWSDPLPLLGFIFPVMLYIKHGMLTQELLIGEK